MTAVLDAALAYAAHGWPVHPLYGPERRVPHPGKQPILGRWQEQATTDPDVISGWWERWPDSNVGLVTGPRSGLAVLDVDPRSGGTDSLAELEERVGALPGTVQSVTGGGGAHLVYRHPGAPIKSRAHSLGRGLDVKGDGGQVVAPPSLHPSGRRYAWLGNRWQEPLPLWPAALMPPTPVARPFRSSAQPAAVPPSRRLAGLVQVVMDATPGERNNRLFWAACRGAEMVTDGTPVEVVADALLLAAEAVGLDRGSSVATVRSALRQQAVAA